jgi:hypothetical protein
MWDAISRVGHFFHMDPTTSAVIGHSTHFTKNEGHRKEMKRRG